MRLSFRCRAGYSHRTITMNINLFLMGLNLIKFKLKVPSFLPNTKTKQLVDSKGHLLQKVRQFQPIPFNNSQFFFLDAQRSAAWTNIRFHVVANEINFSCLFDIPSFWHNSMSSISAENEYAFICLFEMHHCFLRLYSFIFIYVIAKHISALCIDIIIAFC